MRTTFLRIVLIFFVTVFLGGQAGSTPYRAENVFLVIIDGARYTETFGDPSHTYVPQMYALSQEGSIIDEFYNDSLTYTSRAIPAIWCGAWTEVHDTVDSYGNDTQYCELPTYFEYYRKQLGMSADSVWYFMKSVYSVWQFSYHEDYGPDYWPTVHSYGVLDREVFEDCKVVMASHHPPMVLLYLANVDHAGHTGDWEYYTSCIAIADSIVAELWEEIEDDPVYAGKTDIIVTNDHGRHDDAHGGFQNHGCGCEGCRHIMFLGLGPDFKQDYISYEYGRIPDIVPTMAEVMGFFPEYCTGEALFDVLLEPELCGDVQGDGMVTTGDGYFILNYFGSGVQPLSCYAANVNGDGSLTTGDGFHLLNFFGSGPELNCGPCEF